MQRIDAHGLFIQQRQCHLASPHVQRCASGEQGCAAHARCAAENADAAGHALVKIQGTAWQPLIECAQGAVVEQPAVIQAGDLALTQLLQQPLHIQSEIGDGKLPAVVRAIASQQPGLERDEAQCVVGAQAAAAYHAAIGAQAAGHIQRQGK